VFFAIKIDRKKTKTYDKVGVSMLRNLTTGGSACSGISFHSIYQGVTIRRNGMRNQRLNRLRHLFFRPGF